MTTVALVLAGSVTAATWPAALRTVGDLPLLGLGPSQAIQLLHANDALMSGQTSVTSNGLTLHVASAHDDGNLVMLTLRVDQAGGRPVAGDGAYPSLTLTDSSGQRLGMAAASVTGAEGRSALVFSRPAGGPGPGTPLTLRADRITVHLGGTMNDTVAGSWTLRFRARPSAPPRDLPVPAPMSARSLVVTVTSVRVSSSYLDVRYDVTGPATAADYAGAELTAPSGSGAPMAYQWPDVTPADSSDLTVRTSHHEHAWSISGPGRYLLSFPVLGPGGEARLATEIDVPHS